jgi:5'-nucleotidase
MSTEDSERVALIDMDGTVADYDAALAKGLSALASPNEGSGEGTDWLSARKAILKSQPGFWENLPAIPEGFKVLDILRGVGFSLNVLTKGPYTTLGAWTEKIRWCRKYLGDTPVTITEDKSLHYGRVLFDDWPPYVTGWLKWRPRGLVIMLSHPWNQGFTHPNVVRLDRDHFNRDLDVLRPRLQAAYDR